MNGERPLSVVVVDGGESVVHALVLALRREGAQAASFADPAEALAWVSGGPVDVVLAGAGPGLDPVRAFKERQPDVEVVVMVGPDAAHVQAEALRAGAYDVLTTPHASPETVVRALRRAGERRRLLGRSRALEEEIARRGEDLHRAEFAAIPRPGPVSDPGALTDLPYAEARRTMLRDFERRYFSTLLRRHGGNLTAAARAAGMDRSNFRRSLKASGLRSPGRPAGGDDARKATGS